LSMRSHCTGGAESTVQRPPHLIPPLAHVAPGGSVRPRLWSGRLVYRRPGATLAGPLGRGTRDQTASGRGPHQIARAVTPPATRSSAASRKMLGAGRRRPELAPFSAQNGSHKESFPRNTAFPTIPAWRDSCTPC
jgi:hypothetical protein